jgi:hypothetical protein
LPAAAFSEASIGIGIRKKKDIDQPRNEANSHPVTVVASTNA